MEGFLSLKFNNSSPSIQPEPPAYSTMNTTSLLTGEHHLGKPFAIIIWVVFPTGIAFLVYDVYRRWCRESGGERQDDRAIDLQSFLARRRLQGIPVLIHAENRRSPTEYSCPICLEELREGDEVRALPPCMHTYHRHCIDPWIVSRSVFCPVCRIQVVGFRHHSNINNVDDDDNGGRDVGQRPAQAPSVGSSMV